MGGAEQARDDINHVRVSRGVEPLARGLAGAKRIPAPSDVAGRTRKVRRFERAARNIELSAARERPVRDLLR